jgi:hypothetical protein
MTLGFITRFVDLTPGNRLLTGTIWDIDGNTGFDVIPKKSVRGTHKGMPLPGWFYRDDDDSLFSGEIDLDKLDRTLPIFH